jgi:hypothetical protein
MSNDMLSRMMSDLAATVCELCQGAVQLTDVIAPLGGEPGKRIFYCEPCSHHTWTDWLGSFGEQANMGKPSPK